MQTLILEESKLNSLLQNIEDLKNTYSSMLNFRKSNESKLVYDNKEIREILNVEDKLIRKYRRDGLIGYSKVGDKFFYQEKDILEFLDKHYHKAYAYEYR